MNYYELFSIKHDATNVDIKKAYRKLALRFHPDRHPDKPHYDKYFKNVNKVYEVLSDAQKRNQYDASINPANEDQPAPIFTEYEEKEVMTYQGHFTFLKNILLMFLQTPLGLITIFGLVMIGLSLIANFLLWLRNLLPD